MPDPLLPADGNGKIEIIRDGPVLPAQIAGQCPYLVKDVIFGSETGKDLRIATAIRYGLLQNNYPPCTRRAPPYRGCTARMTVALSYQDIPLIGFCIFIVCPNRPVTGVCLPNGFSRWKIARIGPASGKGGILVVLFSLRWVIHVVIKLQSPVEPLTACQLLYISSGGILPRCTGYRCLPGSAPGASPEVPGIPPEDAEERCGVPAGTRHGKAREV